MPASPARRLSPPWFHFSSGYVAGVVGTPDSARRGVVSPANYWLLHLPLWPFILPGFLVGTLWLVKWRDARRGRGRGFEVSVPTPAE